MPTEMHNVLFDSRRWEGFEFRDDDIVISTPPKCGTTWTQMLVALLIFDTPDLPSPLARLSPWLDMNTRSLAEVRAEVDAQTHRRFIKSHLPFDALPHDERVTYVCVGRDPRDVALSMAHHMSNIDFEVFMAQRIAAVGMEDVVDMKPEDVPVIADNEVDGFWNWVEGNGSGPSGLEAMVHHLRSFWQHRDDPNVVMLHYNDLHDDLVGQMTYLARRLGIERSAERIAELAPFARFDAMRSAAEKVAPNSDQGFWRSTTDFFHKGTTGQWRDVVGANEMPRYAARLNTLADAEFARWLHHGAIDASYTEAFKEWDASENGDLWDSAAADGTDD
ncbi:MAG: sulfotransferase domain-containing protein [Actinobacteria bacterium]|nr:sulfotransferase domain-containing protein [Actinomycetota bacterium]